MLWINADANETWTRQVGKESVDVTDEFVGVGNDVPPTCGEELATWNKGVAADSGAEWGCGKPLTWQVACRPHPTAIAADAITLVQEDIVHQVRAGLLIKEVVFWNEIKDRLPANFKVLPVASVVPQTAGQRGQIILDLSFPIRRPLKKQAGLKRWCMMGEVMAESVNKTTTKLAPQGPAHEIRQDLAWLFHFRASRPKDHETQLSKVDLSDGFGSALWSLRRNVSSAASCPTSQERECKSQCLSTASGMGREPGALLRHNGDWW